MVTLTLFGGRSFGWPNTRPFEALFLFADFRALLRGPTGADESQPDEQTCEYAQIDSGETEVNKMINPQIPATGIRLKANIPCMEKMKQLLRLQVLQ